MQEIKCEFLEAVDRTHNVKSFRFLLNQEFNFEIGQFVKVIFDEENQGNKDLNKVLSLSCCPGRDYIEVTKKISESEFSKSLTGLKKGDEVLFRGPMGNLTISQVGEKSCFLVGGIGITPVVPIIEYIVCKEINRDIILIYSNWTEQDIAYKEEFESFSSKNENIKIVHVLAQGDDDKYLKGYITKEVIEQSVKDYVERDFFVFGPPKMVDAMKDICGELGIEKEKIKFESFIGY